LLSKLNRQNCVLGMIDTNRGVQKKNRLKCNSIVRVTVLIRVKIMAIFADVFFFKSLGGTLNFYGQHETQENRAHDVL